MVSPRPPPGSPAALERERVRRQVTIMVGLLLTFVGLAALSVVLPTSTPSFPGDIAPFAAGVVGLFAGGILLGFGLGVRRRRSG